MRHVIDASVVLAVCQNEPGMEEARHRMRFGLISAVNASEVYQKSLACDRLSLARAIMATAGIEVVPFTNDVALIAAEIHPLVKGRDISFADRACLALGMAEHLTILTGDHAWIHLPIDAAVETFRQMT